MGQNWLDFDENEAPGSSLKTPGSGIGFGAPGPPNYTVLNPPPKKKSDFFVEGGVPKNCWGNFCWGGRPPPFLGAFFGGGGGPPIKKRLDFRDMPLPVFLGGAPPPDATEGP